MVKSRFSAIAYLVVGLAGVMINVTQAQEVIELPHEDAESIKWAKAEKEYFSDIWTTAVITNVSAPTLHVLRPPEGTSNGASVIVAPGGGFYALSIESEGNDVARWLADQGFTVFVLKYRLVPTGEDGVQEVSNVGDRFGETIAPIVPLAIADGINAVSFVRTNADRFDLDPQRIGFMGFSAGGTVTLGVTVYSDSDSRPDFIVPVYPAVSLLGPFDVPDNAPRMLVICASDDVLGLATESIDLYSAWHAKGVSAALHMYSQGDHGFGMRKQGLPSDTWIERFYDWSLAEGIAE